MAKLEARSLETFGDFIPHQTDTWALSFLIAFKAIWLIMLRGAACLCGKGRQAFVLQAITEQDGRGLAKNVLDFSADQTCQVILDSLTKDSSALHIWQAMSKRESST